MSGSSEVSDQAHNSPDIQLTVAESHPGEVHETKQLEPFDYVEV